MKCFVLIAASVLSVGCSQPPPQQFPTTIYASQEAKRVEFGKVPYESLSEGVSRKAAHGDNLQQLLVVVKKGFVIPKHQHLSEQMSTVLEGKFKVTIFYPDNKKKITVINEGDVFFIPSNIPHIYEALEDSRVQEVFFPARKELIPR